MNVFEWLIGCGLGVIFGIFPAWWWCSAMIIHAAVYEAKQLPRLMMSGANNNPGLGLFHMVLFHKKYYLTMMRTLAIAWVIASLAIAQYVAFFDYAKEDIIDVIRIEISFSLFLMLTWLVPPYFLKRYLRRLQPKEHEAT